MFEDIIPPLDRELLELELTEDKFVKKTNNGDNLIYIVSVHDSPNLMEEIGRLREVTFRDAGGGTGHKIDIDMFDTDPNPFLQLIVWNTADREITGGYRFIHGSNIMRDDSDIPFCPTAEIFTFSDTFKKDLLPVTIELGRSWVQPKYQPTNDFRKGIYSLDNLWDGLGGLMMRYPDIEYFYGKITMYPTFNRVARDLILGFLNVYFPDDDKLVIPFPELRVEPELDKQKIEHYFKGDDFDKEYKALVRLVRHHGEQVPPLINAYANLSSTMKVFGTAVNPHFGDVEETGILIRIADIYPEKKDRHMKT